MTRFVSAGSSRDSPGSGPPDGVEQVDAADLLEDVAGRSRHDRGDQGLVVRVRREHDADDVRIGRPHFPTDLDPAPVRQSHVEDGHVGFQGGDARQCIGHGPGLAHHGDVVTRLEQCAQSRADDLMIVKQKYRQRHGHILPFRPRTGLLGPA